MPGAIEGIRLIGDAEYGHSKSFQGKREAEKAKAPMTKAVKGAFREKRRFQIIEPIASPKALVGTGFVMESCNHGLI